MTDRAAHVENPGRLEIRLAVLQVGHYRLPHVVIQRAEAAHGVDVHGPVVDRPGGHIIRAAFGMIAAGLAVDIDGRVIGRDGQVRVEAQRAERLGRPAGAGNQLRQLTRHACVHRLPHHLLAGPLQRAPGLIVGLVAHDVADFVAVFGRPLSLLLKARLGPPFVDVFIARGDPGCQVQLQAMHKVLAGEFVVVRPGQQIVLELAGHGVSSVSDVGGKRRPAYSLSGWQEQCLSVRSGVRFPGQPGSDPAFTVGQKPLG